MRRARLAAALLCACVASPAAGEPPVRNGFRLEPSAVPAEQIREGGPGRDEIVALDAPKTLDAAASPWDPEAPVVGVAIGGQSRAYPLAVLEWHEVANDTLGGVDIAVTYSPLSGTALVFDRRQDGETLRFGVSGLLYQSNLLLYDRQSESLWSQIAARALTGKRMGARLRLLRSRIEPWSAWRERHPGTTALSPETGHRRPYGASPFGDYALSERVLFPDPAPDPRYHPKMPTLGLRVADGTARGYPAEELARAGGRVQETVAGRQVRVAYDAERQVFDVEAPDDVERVEGFWFAWAAFHPQASVFTGPPPAAP